MGDDTFDNEDEMLKMWGESMKDVNNKTALINYEDFVLLMKGQKRDRVTTRMGRPSITEGLAAVPEISSEDDDDHNAPLLAQSTPLRSFNEMEPLDTTPKNAEIVAAPARKPTLIPKNGSPDLMSAAIPSPDRKHFVRMGSNSAPATPLHYGKRFDEIDQVAESPHGMDEDGENVGGVSFNEQCAVFTVPDLDLTPPQTPVRSAADFITPTVGRPTLDPNLISGLTPPDLSLPSIMPGNISIPADLTKRGRSVSMDEKETYTSKVEAESRKSMLFKRDSRRAMAIPEHTHTVSDIDNAIKDKTKTPLVVNRKLYRAHREFRHAVTEACKRFEDEQMRRAKETLKARENAHAKHTAGLVMRHGQALTEQSIKNFLKKTLEEQQKQVDQANRRGGRGRRGRKKTVSDMSGMLGGSALPAEAATESTARQTVGNATLAPKAEGLQPVKENENLLRNPTKPGEFRKTNYDPFQRKSILYEPSTPPSTPPTPPPLPLA